MPSCPSPPSRGSPSHHHPLLQKQAAPSGTRAEDEALAKPGWQLEAPHAAWRRQLASPSASQLQSVPTAGTAGLHPPR